jgi:hypothetical protein
MNEIVHAVRPFQAVIGLGPKTENLERGEISITLQGKTAT